MRITYLSISCACISISLGFKPIFLRASGDFSVRGFLSSPFWTSNSGSSNGAHESTEPNSGGFPRRPLGASSQMVFSSSLQRELCPGPLRGLWGVGASGFWMFGLFAFPRGWLLLSVAFPSFPFWGGGFWALSPFGEVPPLADSVPAEVWVSTTRTGGFCLAKRGSNWFLPWTFHPAPLAVAQLTPDISRFLQLRGWFTGKQQQQLVCQKATFSGSARVPNKTSGPRLFNVLPF